MVQLYQTPRCHLYPHGKWFKQSGQEVVQQYITSIHYAVFLPFLYIEFPFNTCSFFTMYV